MTWTMHISLEIITHDKKQTIEQCLLLRSQVFLGAYKQSRKISSSPCGVHSARYMRVMICETRRHFARRRRTIFAAGACSFSLCGTRRVPSRRRVSSCVPFVPSLQTLRFLRSVESRKTNFAYSTVKSSERSFIIFTRWTMKLEKRKYAQLISLCVRVLCVSRRDGRVHKVRVASLIKQLRGTRR